MLVLIAGLVALSTPAFAQRAEVEMTEVIELPLMAVTAMGDRPGFEAAPRRPAADRLGRRHRGALPLRAHFRAKVAASAGAL
jgi:hypothetical protein